MSRRARRWLIVFALVCCALSVLAYFVGAGRAMGGMVSNCNRDCEDGSHAMYVSIALVGMSVVSFLVAAFAPKPPPPIPNARVTSSRR